MSFQDVPLDRIGLIPFVSRENDESGITELANSMSTLGQQSPVKLRRARPGGSIDFDLIFGNRRLLAAKKLGWATIKAEIVEASDEELLVMALAENVNRSDFRDYEKAKLFRGLRDKYGWSLEKIAGSLGKSVSYISQHISMLNLFREASQSCDETDPERIRILRNLTEGHSRIIRRLPSIKDRVEVSKLVVLGKLGVRETQRSVARILDGRTRKSRKVVVGRKVAELNELVKRFCSAYEKASVPEILELRHQSGFSMFDDFPPFERLHNENSVVHTSQIADTIKNVRYIVDGIEVNPFGNFAVVSLYVKCLGTYNDGPYQQVSRISLVLLYESHTWKIVHEHWSTIFHDPYPGIWLQADGEQKEKSVELRSFQLRTYS